MNELREHEINVFVFDRNGVAIPNAVVQAIDHGKAIDDGKVIAEATTQGYPATPVKLFLSPQYKLIELKAKVAGYEQGATVGVDVGNFTFKFPEIELGRPRPTAAAWVFGGILLVFLMGVVIWNPRDLLQTQREIVRLLGSVFGGIIAAFFTGSLSLAGKIPKLSNIEIGAIGGFAVFVLIYFSWGR